MKTLTRTLLLACAVATPALAFAQSTPDPITRAQVYADLVRVEQAGYRPGDGDNTTYPVNLQRAEAKIAAQDAARAAGVATVAQQSAKPAQLAPAHLTASMPTHHYRIDDARSVFTDGA